MKVYYWKERKNFGDALASYLLERWTHIHAEWAPPQAADIVVCGSVLEHMPPEWKGVIAGAGQLHEKSKIHLPNARILAVRGPLTAKQFEGTFALGDPGLLADELVSLPEKKYDLGIVPHWTDKKLEHVQEFRKYRPKIIRVDGDVLDVVRQIGECKKIVSSSLHGIILADAFGIPRRIELSEKALSPQEGGLFKWLDYSRSVGMPLEIGKTMEANRNVIIEKQHEMFDVFEEITGIFSRA